MSLLIKRKNLPSELQDVYVDFYWSTKKLWALELPVKEISIDKLDWILDYPIWYLDPVTVPNTLIKNPASDIESWERVTNADLTYPIHIIEWKNRLLILDGVHRLVKAKELGLTSIKVKQLTPEILMTILPDEEDFKTGFLKKAIT